MILGSGFHTSGKKQWRFKFIVAVKCPSFMYGLEHFVISTPTRKWELMRSKFKFLYSAKWRGKTFSGSLKNFIINRRSLINFYQMIFSFRHKIAHVFKLGFLVRTKKTVKRCLLQGIFEHRNEKKLSRFILIVSNLSQFQGWVGTQKKTRNANHRPFIGRNKSTYNFFEGKRKNDISWWPLIKSTPDSKSSIKILIYSERRKKTHELFPFTLSYIFPGWKTKGNCRNENTSEWKEKSGFRCNLLDWI